MRLHIRTTGNTQPVPFSYQRALVGAFHKWLGKNDIHDTISLYSLGWLHGGKQNKGALQFKAGASWQISSPDPEMLQTLINGIQDDPEIAYGMRVNGLLIQQDPEFSTTERFVVQSPVLVKRTLEGSRVKFYLYDEPEADELLTETLKHKLVEAGTPDINVSVGFDRSHHNPRPKLVTYNGIKIKASLCPVIINGDPEAIAFAWNVGVGNSTGIGFGALK